MLIVNPDTPRYAELARNRHWWMEESPPRNTWATDLTMRTNIFFGLSLGLFIGNLVIFVASPSVFMAILIAVILVPFAVTSVNFYRYQKVRKNPRRYYFNCLGSGGLGIADRLGEIVDRYENNKKAIANTDMVMIGSDTEFYAHAWKIAMDLRRLQKASALGRSKDILKVGIERLGTECDSLTQAVENLSDVAIIDTVDKVVDGYLDPTFAESMKHLAQGRLAMKRELMLMSGSPEPEPEVEVVKLTTGPAPGPDATDRVAFDYAAVKTNGVIHDVRLISDG